MMNTELAFAGTADLRMTGEARASLLAAERLARKYGSAVVTTEHFLLALLDPPSIPLRLMFANLRVDVASLVARLQSMNGVAESRHVTSVEFDSAMTAALDRAADEARGAGDELVDSRHLLLGMLAMPATPAGMLLREAGVSVGVVRTELKHRGQIRPTTLCQLVSAIRVSPLFLALLGVMILSGIGLVFMPESSAIRALIAVFIISGWVVQLCIHEFGHAAAAYLGGDREVVSRGYLTLDPRKYTHPLLSIVMPLVFMFMGGLPLPGGAVRINTSALRSRRWELIISAAGPAGTLFSLLVISLPFLILGNTFAYGRLFYLSASSAGLGEIFAAVLILNLLPIPPLDGFQIISHWLPEDVREKGYQLGFLPMLVLFGLLSRPGPFNDGFWVMADSVSRFMHLPLVLGEYALWLIHF
jgi:Zn-dependent protease